MKNVFAALCLFFSVISISCSAEIMSFIPNQTVRYKITQEMRGKVIEIEEADEDEDEEEECENYESTSFETELEVDVTVLSDNEIVDSYPIEVECVVRSMKGFEDYVYDDDDDDDDDDEYDDDEDDEDDEDSWIDKPIRFCLDEDGQIVVRRDYEPERIVHIYDVDSGEEYIEASYSISDKEYLEKLGPFLKETFCLVGQNLVSGESYPINIFQWLDRDYIFPFTLEILESESNTNKGAYTANNNFVIGKMDEESIETVMESNARVENDWKDLLDDGNNKFNKFLYEIKITFSGNGKWQRSNPFIHECCLQYSSYSSLDIEASTGRKSFLEIQWDCILKWETILPSLPSKE